MKQTVFFASVLICGLVWNNASQAASRIKLTSDAQLGLSKETTREFDRNPLLNSPQLISQQLANLASDVDKIVLTDALLKDLQQLSPTTAQINWVEQQSQNEGVIYIENIDHPNQQIELVNIANQAKVTKRLWLVNDKAKQYSLEWQQGFWSEIHNEYDELFYQATAKALTSATPEQTEWLIGMIKQQPVSRVNNRLVAVISGKSADYDLINQVWMQAANEYSYQLLQQVPQLFDSEQAIEQLKQACNNSKLTSHALMLLAKSYPDKRSSQEFIIKQLISDNNQWHAAMAATVIENIEFQQAIHQLVKTNNSAAVSSVISHYKEAM